MKELESTYLIQRLNTPHPGYDNPFSFGGGLKNGGLSEDAMKLLRPIFSFDYMGSAEFEYGAIPECLKYIAKNIMDYSMHELKVNKLPVYIIGLCEQAKQIDDVIILLSKNKVWCKESTHFDAALGLNKYWKKDNCHTFGWLELDNRFFFFTDKNMAYKTADVFGIAHPEK